jgi:hypothetical protein
VRRFGVTTLVAFAWLVAAASLTTALLATAGGAGNGATTTELGAPTAAVPTPDGGFLVTDHANCTVNKVSGAGTIATVAGDGSCEARTSGPVSCPTATFCAVVYGRDGIAVTSNPGAATPAWVIATGVVPDGLLTAISCASASFCAAVGANGEIVTSTNPTGGKAAWHLRASFETDTLQNGIRGIACPATTLCVMTGRFGKTYTTTNPTAGTTPGAGADWTTVRNLGSFTRGVTCASVSLCVAYGEKFVISTNPTGVSVGSTAGDDWRTSFPPSTSDINGVSCTGPSFCALVDGQTHVTTSTNPTSAPPSWTSTAVPSAFHDISCPSTSFCAAYVGGKIFTSTDPGGATPAWTSQNTDGLASDDSCGDSVRTICTVECPAASLCMAGADLGTLLSTNPTGGRAAWRQQEPGDGGPATAVSLTHPSDAVPAPGGGFLVQEGGFSADSSSDDRSDVRKVGADGKMTRVAGTGAFGQAGGGPAVEAKLFPTSVVPFEAPGQAVFSPGDGFLLADTLNCIINRVKDNGTIEVVAGNGACDHTGDNGGPLAAELAFPISAVPTPDGGFLIAEFGSLFPGFGGGSIRKVSGGPSPKITTVAGSGAQGYSGDGGAATAAKLSQPTSAVPTKDGGFLIADWGNNVVRKVAADGTISTVAGSGDAGEDGDGGRATEAELIGPTAAVPTPDGGFLVSSYTETGSDLVVRKVTKEGVIGTVAGTNEGTPGKPPIVLKPKPKCVFKSAKLKVVKKKPKIRVRAVCDRAATAKVGGKITRKIKRKGKPTTTKTYKLKPKSVSAGAAKVVTITLGLPKGAVTGLKKGDRESAALTLKGTNANGTGPTAKRTIKKLTLKKPASAAAR